MARLLRIEVCAECSHCQREYASDDMDSVCHCDLLNPDATVCGHGLCVHLAESWMGG